MSDGKVPMQASGQESKGAATPDGVNSQAERGAAGESDFAGDDANYPREGTIKDEESGGTGFFGHGGQSHLSDRSKNDELPDEVDG